MVFFYASNFIISSISNIDDTVSGGSGVKLGVATVYSAIFFAISATLVSLLSIWMQFKHYRKPILQRYVVRILIMVPLYSISSSVSLLSRNAAFYIDAVRDIYEAFVIYCFFALLVNYLGGERSLLIMLHGRTPKHHLWPISLIYFELDLSDPYTLLFLKRGIFQYVYIKPILAIVTMYLKATDSYMEGYISVTSGYFWISLVYNLSVATSLYCLAMFWVGTSSDLKPFRPIPKFLSIKSIIFFSFWQGFAISLLVYVGIINSTNDYDADNIALAIQDALICFEMPFAALMHWYAFSHKDYEDFAFSQTARLPVYYAFRDAFGIRDIVEDSLQTVRGTGFSYRTFEPVEGGVVHMGRGRERRIAAGLRYTQGGRDKYWIEGRNNPEGRGLLIRKVSSSSTELEFDEPDNNEDGLYESARRLEHGDYNYPSIQERNQSDDDRSEDNGIIDSVKRTWQDATGIGKKEKEIENAVRKRVFEQHPYLKPKRRQSIQGTSSQIGRTIENQVLTSKKSKSLERRNIENCVDLVVEDKEAEEKEMVRRRRDGGPMPSPPPRRYKVLNNYNTGENQKKSLWQDRGESDDGDRAEQKSTLSKSSNSSNTSNTSNTNGHLKQNDENVNGHLETKDESVNGHLETKDESESVFRGGDVQEENVWK